MYIWIPLVSITQFLCRFLPFCEISEDMCTSAKVSASGGACLHLNMKAFPSEK